jgi:2-methylcitrate dehydratase PrpD
MDASASNHSLSGQLARHVVGVGPDDIPPSAREAGRLFMLDTLAVAWAGSDAAGCRETLAMLEEEGSRPQSTAWAYGARLSPAAAAFINGMTSAALDYDSLGRNAPVHVPIVVLPAALAIAESRHASGRDFLTAFVIGCDVLCRLGSSIDPPHQGFFYTSSHGGLGAAAAAARLLGLDATETMHALGLAFSQASGTMQANIEPSLTKRMLSGFAARAGVHAALLAKRGITSPSEVIEGKFGLFALYQRASAQRLIAKLGTEFQNTELSVKKYPSCGCNHTAIEATLNLIRRYEVKADDVESIEVIVSPYIDRISGMRYDPSPNPQVAAQFSIRYSIACMLVRRKLGLAEIQADAATDPAILRHVGKVTVVVDEALTGERGPVTVKLKTRSHGAIENTVEYVPGSHESPLSELELGEKFGECFRTGANPLSVERAQLLTQRVRTIEEWPDMATFFDGVISHI